MNIPEDEPQVVNIFEFGRLHGLSEQAAMQLVLHMLITRTYAVESDVREAASELRIFIPFVFPDNGTLH